MRTRKNLEDSWANTGFTLLWTVLLGIPIPAFIAYLGWQLDSTASGSEWMAGVSNTVYWTATCLFLLNFSLAILREKGLGEAHFGWNSVHCASLRHEIVLFAIGYIPLLFVAHLSLYITNRPETFHALGRLTFLAALVWVTIIAQRSIHGKKGLLVSFTQDHPETWVARLRPLFWILGLGLPFGLIILTVLGYLYSAFSISLHLEKTAFLLILAPLSFGLILRIFSVKARRMALEKLLEERRQNLEKLKSESDGDEEPPQDAVELVEPEIDLKLVGTQTRSLLIFVIGSAFALMIWFSWVQFVPAADRFANFGKIGAFSISSLVIAVSLLVVTTVFARNLPGLVEFILVQTISVDSGIRNAVSKIVAYLIVIIGLTMTLQALDIDWNQFGWIAAALSVGLGFGLQEIVANFVCGLILLFERPIRLGDTVTIGDVTGVVSRIQIRATTITDLDRKEFVVPNKEFITGTLKNWTLSDTTTRMLITVGIAYGSDVDRASEILLDVVTSHPGTSVDPAPSVTFDNFGDSSLNLVLRVYLASLENRFRILHDLNKEIHSRFMEDGIEIPFPQRDLNFKNIND